MNPPTPVDAVAQVTQATGGSATRQAIQAALAGLTLDSTVQQAQAGEQDALRTQQDGVRGPLATAAASTQGTWHTQTAGLAATGSDLQAPAGTLAPGPSLEAAAVANNVAPPPAVPLHGVLAVPVALSQLQAPSIARSARSQRPAQHERLSRVQRHEGEAGQSSTHDEDCSDDAQDAQADAAPSAVQNDNAEPDGRMAGWFNHLSNAGQDEALRDLRLSRHVLLLLPQRAGHGGTVPARAVLLSARGVIELRAQWWPGAAALTPATAPPVWQRFRLFRDGDLLSRGGLRTRSGSMACRLLLGTSSAAAANAALGAFNVLGGLNDTSTARLMLTERSRVAQALVAQWTLLLLVVPGEASHA